MSLRIILITSAPQETLLITELSMKFLGSDENLHWIMLIQKEDSSEGYEAFKKRTMNKTNCEHFLNPRKFMFALP